LLSNQTGLALIAMPGHALVVRIGEDDVLLPEQQAIGFNHVIDLAQRCAHHMCQTTDLCQWIGR
jgi:hypothetical protein